MTTWRLDGPARTQLDAEIIRSYLDVVAVADRGSDGEYRVDPSLVDLPVRGRALTDMLAHARSDGSDALLVDALQVLARIDSNS